MMSMFKRGFIITSIIFTGLLLSCNSDSFYTARKDGDLWRLPLLEPYELIAVGDIEEPEWWNLCLNVYNPYNWKDRYQLSNIDSVGVKNNLILVHSKKVQRPNSYTGGWFLIDPCNKQELFFSNRHDLEVKMIETGVKNIRLYPLKKVLEKFKGYNTFFWKEQIPLQCDTTKTKP